MSGRERGAERGRDLGCERDLRGSPVVGAVGVGETGVVEDHAEARSGDFEVVTAARASGMSGEILGTPFILSI